MSLHASVWAWKQSVENPLRKLILLHMADSASEHNGWQSWYSLSKIGERCNCSRDSVRRHLHELVESGYLTMTKAATPFGNKAAKYRLNVGAVEIQNGPSKPVDNSGEPPSLQGLHSATPLQRATPGVAESNPPGVAESNPRGSRVLPEPVSTVSIEPVKEPSDPKPASLSAPKESGEPEKPKEPKGRRTWNAYAHAYARRYGGVPVSNARVRGQIAHFVDRVGVENAPQVASYFLGSNKRWHVEKRHSVGIMLADAEALHNEWMTGNRVTSTQATQMDRTQSNYDVVQRVIAKRTAEGKM